ncbi:hypothetical protein PLEOSDRAFT_1104955 [Pleurotus ostreatus PC15]|uniref:Fungal-type protein kinase domain-containing protein n=1 Tax=Pleurotus ostreatus (strain PC15) TaxID=1137138 RepID=A0A067NK24_PLEO1|nr:hypothetical protein PLEOSDRAFT_1104955 [Pleurotus ostreatus PC15]
MSLSSKDSRLQVRWTEQTDEELTEVQRKEAFLPAWYRKFLTFSVPFYHISALQASIWWLQVICVMEMKRKDSQTGMDIVKQLIGYLRRILREQLDCRFVFGMTMGPNRMTVWLHDHSGVLGTAESNDMFRSWPQMPERFEEVREFPLATLFSRSLG